MNLTITNNELALEVARLRKESTQVGNQLRRRTRNAAILLKDAVVGTVLEMGLHRAAAATYLGGGDPASVRVDTTRAPYAAPLNNPNDGEFNRHPVFGHEGTQVEQPARRFLDRGIERGLPAAYREGDKVLDDIVQAL